MSVLVVRIRRMGIRMGHGLMRMQVAVAGAVGNARVRVNVVSVIVSMGVFMLHCFENVHVLVFMVLSQVQRHVRQHERAAQRKSHDSTDERSERKYRARTCCASK